MELVNQTPVVARAVVSTIAGTESRMGFITAKATFRFDARGAVVLDDQDPVPLYDADEATELGLRPRDDFPRGDPAFEVILLGAAYSPGREPVAQRTVALAVGRERRELLVTGDRYWVNRTTMSQPEPFARIPLTYERTYGGTCEVLIDRDSPVDVSDPMNPVGRGFDPEPTVRGLAQTLRPPKGFPAYDARRALPNVEKPDQRITRWEDAPSPACWATVPMSTAFHALRSVEQPRVNRFTRDEAVGAVKDVLARDWIRPGMFHRAHPDWVIPLPEREARVELEGVVPEDRAGFNLPALSVVADWIVGDASGTRTLVPQMLVLLPEEKRFYLLYRHRFTVRPSYEVERCFRIRLEKGWFAPASEGAS